MRALGSKSQLGSWSLKQDLFVKAENLQIVSSCLTSIFVVCGLKRGGEDANTRALTLSWDSFSRSKFAKEPGIPCEL